MEELHPYYQERERKNMALIDCCGKAIMYAVLIGIGLAMWYLMYRGFMSVFWGH